MANIAHSQDFRNCRSRQFCRNRSYHIAKMSLVRTRGISNACAHTHSQIYAGSVYMWYMRYSWMVQADGRNAGSSCHRALSLLMFTQDLHMSVCPINSWYTASTLHCIPSQTHTGMHKFHGTEYLHDHQLPYQNSQLCQDIHFTPKS